MMEQDTQLDNLGDRSVSHLIAPGRWNLIPADSIRRQRDLSMRIGDELEVHTGLLESLDSEVDSTTVCAVEILASHLWR